MSVTKIVNVFPLVVAENLSTLPYLSLGMVTTYLREWNAGLLNKSYAINRLILGGVDEHPVEHILSLLKHEEAPVCLFSSYVWNHKINIATMKKIKAINPEAIVIVGGPEIPKYQDETELFLNENPCVDFAVLGEGEVSCAEILHALTQAYPLEHLSKVNGIVYRDGTRNIRTSARDRIVNVNELPSPYLLGEFEPWFEGFGTTVLETNRGCPYGCTYCDWGSATLETVTKFSPERVFREIEYIAQKHGESIFIADANFGMLEQDIEIAKALVEVRKRTGYPKRLFSNFAKNGGRRLMAVIKILHEGGLLPTGIIALQTTDKATLKAIKRDNIKTSAYEKMMEYFNSENIPMASDIMIGLPGQTIDSLQRDLQFCFDWKVSANGNYTSMMPNAPMAEKSYRSQYQIETDNSGMIASTLSFTAQDLDYMKNLFRAYQFHVRLGLLKYYLYFVQVEHGVAAIELLRRWLDRVLEGDEALPISRKIFKEAFKSRAGALDWAPIAWGDEAGFFFSDLEAYYHEIYCFTQREFQLEIDTNVLATLVAVQAAVTPRVDRSYPYSVYLTHDIERYFSQIKVAPSLHHLDNTFTPLKAFGASTFNVTPEVSEIKSIRYTYFGGHSDDWELPSPLRFY